MRGVWIVVRIEDLAAAVHYVIETASDQGPRHVVGGKEMHAPAKVAECTRGDVRDVVVRAAVPAPVVDHFLGPGDPYDRRIPRRILRPLGKRRDQ